MNNLEIELLKNQVLEVIVQNKYDPLKLLEEVCYELQQAQKLELKGELKAILKESSVADAVYSLIKREIYNKHEGYSSTGSKCVSTIPDASVCLGNTRL